MDIAVLGVDLGKNLCSVGGLDSACVVVMRRRVRRETLIRLAEKLPPCIDGMEACCGVHHFGRGQSRARGRVSRSTSATPTLKYSARSAQPAILLPAIPGPPW